MHIQNDDDGLQEKRWREALLDWLSFAEIDHRGAQIATAHANTFSWIFEGGNSTGFVEWLRHGNGIYWIQGKPASGKSTLMNYIAREPRLQHLSTQWSGTKKLIISSFWFWSAGSELQKSLSGLFRTLLFHILRKMSRACRVAFPEWRTTFKHSTQVPTPEMLIQAMSNVIRDGSFSTNYFFTIDGLDEYNRGNDRKMELVELFLSLAQYPNVKLLLSSRPEVPFATGFKNCPCLRLETLTRADIRTYVRAKLWSNLSLREITRAERMEVQKIAEFAIEQCDGVFLWVVLVIRIARLGINDHDSFEMIRRRIIGLPRDLEVLFTQILEKTLPQHQEEASRYLLLVLEWWKLTDNRSMSPEVLAISQHTSSYEDICRLADLGASEYTNLKSRVQTRIMVCCNGLLQTGASIGVLHKTFLDFLLQQQETADSCYTMLRTRAGPEFNVHVGLMAGLIARLKHGWNTRKLKVNYEYRNSFRSMASHIFTINAYAERLAPGRPTQLLDIFDNCMSQKLADLVTEWQLTHWTDVVFGKPKVAGYYLKDFGLSSRTLGYAVMHGASLCLRSAISEGGGMTIEKAQYILCYAAPSRQRLDHVLVGGMPWGGSRSTTINAEAANVLLEHGVDPMHGASGENPWQNTISWMGMLDQLDDCDLLLELMKLFAKHTSDPSKLLTIEHDGLIASTAIQTQALETKCCLGKTITWCECPKARKLTRLANELLELIDRLT